jgi:hypothetical protein
MNKSDAINSVSSALNINRDWLNKLIEFESSWNPQATNPLSGARGLIQFTHTTARELGFADANALVRQYPDAVSQLLGPVYQYLNKYKPFPTAQSLYMAVFYPTARNWSPQTPFSNAIQALNPGIKTVQDYISKVEKSGWGKTIVMIAIAAIGGYFIYQNFFKGVDVWPTKKAKQIEIVREI